jgi:hypothetical protein
MQLITPLAATIPVLPDKIALSLRQQPLDKIQKVLISEMLLVRYLFQMKCHPFPVSVSVSLTLRQMIFPKDISHPCACPHG